jgi:hypothetical protein
MKDHCLSSSINYAANVPGPNYVLCDDWNALDSPWVNYKPSKDRFPVGIIYEYSSWFDVVVYVLHVIELNEFGDQMQLSLISSKSTSDKDDPASSRGCFRECGCVWSGLVGFFFGWFGAVNVFFFKLIF